MKIFLILLFVHSSWAFGKYCQAIKFMEEYVFGVEDRTPTNVVGPFASSMQGTKFRAFDGKIVLLPAAAYLSPNLQTSSYQDSAHAAYREAILELQRYGQTAEAFLRFRLSQDVMEWMKREEGLPSVKNLEFRGSGRTERYMLPDQTLIWLSPKSFEVLNENWSRRHRPGNM